MWFEQENEKKVEKLKIAKNNILKAQEKQKHYYDIKRANPKMFNVDQLVLLKVFYWKKRKGGKLDSKYVGSFKIIRARGKGVYYIENEASGKVSRAIGSHLKEYSTVVHKHRHQVNNILEFFVYY